MSQSFEKINAPFRWAGSKAKLTNELFEYFKDGDTYVEAFLGSGVVLFRLLQLKRYKNYIVNDINKAIIEFYRTIKFNPLFVIHKLNIFMDEYNSHSSLEEKEDYYYGTRYEFNKDKSNWGYFWILMKTGFNGLYRENKKGEYNVPFGKKEKITFDQDEILMIHELIQDVEFYCMDFEELYSMIQEHQNTFAYNDPPYPDSQPYTADGFNHQRLVDTLNDLKMIYAISSIDSKRSDEIYQGFYKVTVKLHKHIINNIHVKQQNEVLYLNFEPEMIQMEGGENDGL